MHEYGGGEFDVDDGVVVYSEFTDGRVYRLRDGAPAVPITPAGGFATAICGCISVVELVLAVREEHGDGEPVNTIVALDLDGENADGGVVLCSGAGFYSSPELSGRDRLAWTEWNHPDMPWDSTMIKMGTLADGRLCEVSEVAGRSGRIRGACRAGSARS